MFRAYVMIKTKTGEARSVKNAVQALSGVREAHLVTGMFDVVALIEMRDTKMLGELIAVQIPNISGVETTTTCIILE